MLREIFRQKLTLQRSHRQVVEAVGVSLGKVSGAVARAAALGLDADAIAQLTDAELEAALYPKRAGAAPAVEHFLLLSPRSRAHRESPRFLLCQSHFAGVAQGSGAMSTAAADDPRRAR